MKMKLKTLAAATLGLGLCAAIPAQATVLSSFLTFDGPSHLTPPVAFPGGGEDKLQDDSLSVWFDKDQNGLFTDGDIVWGVLTLSEIDASGINSEAIGANSQISIIFSGEINGTGAGGAVNLDPVADANNLLDLRKILAPSITASAGLDDDSIAVVLSTRTPSGANAPADPATSADPLNWDVDQANYNDGDGLFTNANDWFWETTMGLVEDGDFFAFAETNPAIPLLGGLERGGFTIQSQAFYVDEWLKVDVNDFAGGWHTADATLDIGTVNIASQDQQDRGWAFRDQASFFVNPIPEPSVLALLGFGLVGLGFGRGRGRKQMA